MKKTMKASFAVAFALLFLLTGVIAAEKPAQKVVDLANSTLAKIGSDPAIVKAVKEQNAKGQTLDQIKAMDSKWMATPGVADFMKALIDNDCGKRVKAIQKSAPYYAEIFVMDNQGANVCMTDKTTDYWQGDEEKFTESYKGGAGAVFIDKVKFDDSTQAYVSQVSVPVKDGGKVIGAITFGIDVEKVK